MDTDLPTSFVREMCATRLAEIAWLRATAVERDALLRVSYFLSPHPQEAPHPEPSREDKALAALKLRGVQLSATSTFAIAADGSSSVVVKRARSVLERAFIAGAELLEREASQ